MFNIIIAVHICLCVTLIGLVLLQQGKGAEAGAIMGGGSNSLLGAGGAGDFISRLTTGIAIAFMITSIMLVKSYNTTTPLSVESFDPLKGSVLGVQKEAATVDAGNTQESASGEVEEKSLFVDEATKDSPVKAGVETAAKAVVVEETAETESE